MFFLRGFIDSIVVAAVAVLDVVVVVAMREFVFDTKKERSRSKKEGSSVQLKYYLECTGHN